MKTAIITGIFGQDGSYLCEELLNKDYKILGVGRNCDRFVTGVMQDAIKQEKLCLFDVDITNDKTFPAYVFNHKFLKNNVDEVYNFAAQSSVSESFINPEYTHKVNFLPVQRILEFIRTETPHTKFFQAGTIEIFGNNFKGQLKDSETGIRFGGYQDESTAFDAKNPYSISKLSSYLLVRMYREAYGLFACNGIFGSHESERRNKKFVTRKITNYVANLYWSLDLCGNYVNCGKLKLGNLDVARDFGYAPDYVHGAYLSIQHNNPDDYVFATGHVYSIRELLKYAFELVGLKWENFVEIDESLFRPVDTTWLKGNYNKAKSILGWKPKVSFVDMIQRMIMWDLFPGGYKDVGFKLRN